MSNLPFMYWLSRLSFTYWCLLDKIFSSSWRWKSLGWPQLWLLAWCFPRCMETRNGAFQTGIPLLGAECCWCATDMTVVFQCYYSGKRKEKNKQGVGPCDSNIDNAWGIFYVFFVVAVVCFTSRDQVLCEPLRIRLQSTHSWSYSHTTWPSNGKINLKRNTKQCKHAVSSYSWNVFE